MAAAMLIRIRHSLHFNYDRPVFLEPMTLRLTPRQDSTQRLLSHTLRLTDEPAGSCRVLEPDGNNALVLWFLQERASFVIDLETEVETLRDNPFDWIVTHPGAQLLPVHYPEAEAASLAPCLVAVATPAVRDWADGMATEVEHSATGFPMRLADEIHNTFHHVGRPDGEPLTPEQTLESRCGACRDTAMLFVAACRSQGLAARFVSGYSIHHPPEVTEHELHAWAEVYLPGGGWRAYDPSLGLAVADGHVALAAAPDHRLAAPVSGTYRGTRVGSRLRYLIEVVAFDPDRESEGPQA